MTAPLEEEPELRTATKLGDRPPAGVRSGCGECGHPKALHSNGETACRAFACTAGPDDTPCPAFVPIREPQPA